MHLIAGVLFVLLSCWCRNHTYRAYAFVLAETTNSNETSASQLTPPINANDNIQPRLLILEKPVALDASPLDQVNGNLLSEATTQANKPCAHKLCPLIYCLNNLPPIPSQGICCTRCVTNPKCNTSTCPILDCPTTIIPANLTAGECCDRCPISCNLRLCPRIACRGTLPPPPGQCCPICLPFTPAPTTTTTTTKKPSKTTKKTTHAPKKTSEKPKSESCEECSQETSEQSGEKASCCHTGLKHGSNNQESRMIHRLIDLLTRFLHNRHDHQSRDDSSSDTRED